MPVHVQCLNVGLEIVDCWIVISTVDTKSTYAAQILPHKLKSGMEDRWMNLHVHYVSIECEKRASNKRLINIIVTFDNIGSRN